MGVNFVSLGRSLTRAVLKLFILVLIHDFAAQEVLGRAILRAKCPSLFHRESYPKDGAKLQKGSSTTTAGD
jgi:hypothetical protein